MPLRIIFAGTPEFAVPSLQALIDARHDILAVYTQPDRPKGRGQKLAESPVKACALAHHLTVCQPLSLKDPKEQQRLKDYKADFMVVVAYGLILPQPILEAPQHGCLNVHASLLPRWRGAAPIQRALLAGDSETGITLMQMDAGLDTGAMLKKATCPILPDDTAQTLHDRLAPLGASLLTEGLEQWNSLTPIPQDDTAATYAKKLEKQEARIDWGQSAVQIARQVRAFTPWPVAFTGEASSPLRVWQAEPLPGPSSKGFLPGQIVQALPHGLDIATGNGVLRILKLQPAGGRILTTSEWLNARRNALTPGSLLT